MLKKIAIQLLCSFILIFGNTTVNAETDLLNLGNYSEGTRVPYGENMVVTQDESTGEKWIQPTKGSSGSLTIPINIDSNSFEVTLEIDGFSTYMGGIFLAADEVNFSFKVGSAGSSGPGLTEIEGNRVDTSVWNTENKNVIKLLVNNGVAKIYANDAFVQKVTLDDKNKNITYTKLLISDLRNNYKIYNLKIEGTSGDVLSNTGITPTITSDCIATYTTDGNLHIPCVSVPDTFGGTAIYDVDMQQQGGNFTFDLNLDSVKKVR